MMIDEDNFINHWLKQEYTKVKSCQLYCVNEKLDKENVKNFLAKKVAEHITTPDLLKALKDLNKEKLAIEIENYVPTKDNIRKGDFGEILTVENLVQWQGYEKSFKLRHKSIINRSEEGHDVFLLKINSDEKFLIGVAETKTHMKYQKITFQNAHNEFKEKLEKDHQFKDALSYMKKELAKDFPKVVEKLAIYSQSIDLNEFPRENWIFLISSNKPKNVKNHIENDDDLIKSMNFVSIHINQLEEFIDEIWGMCPNAI